MLQMRHDERMKTMTAKMKRWQVLASKRSRKSAALTRMEQTVGHRHNQPMLPRMDNQLSPRQAWNLRLDHI